MASNQLSRHSIDDAAILDIVAAFQETAVADDDLDSDVDELPGMDPDGNKDSDLTSYMLIPCRYANQAARFISGYKYGLTGGEAAWAT